MSNIEYNCYESTPKLLKEIVEQLVALNKEVKELREEVKKNSK